MKIFLDTVVLEEIKEFSWIVDGVTTTPTFFVRDGISYESFIENFVQLYPNLELHIEALGSTVNETRNEIEKIITSKWFNKEKIVLKIPVSIENLLLVKEYSKRGIKFNTHLVFTAQQAALAALANAYYVCPLMGRYADKMSDLHSKNLHGGLDDFGKELISEIIRSVKNINEGTTKVMASSIRSKGDFLNAIYANADVITVPTKILRDSFEHTMTKEGTEKFLADLNIKK